MKKYVSPIVELNDALDIIATSADVTTGSIKFPWSTSDGVSASSYELLAVKELGTGNTVAYEL